MSTTLNWGILGAGNIAKQFARGVAGSASGKLLAIGSRSQEKAEKFANEFGVPKRYGSYEALLADPEVHAVYIATPHPEHAFWAIEAAEAKKHILCEKPLGVNHGQAMAMIEAARDNDVFLMEAYMYRCHPLMHKVVGLIREKAIGQVRAIHASFAFQSTFKPDARLWANEMAGGGILDVGGYPVSFARLVAGAALGLPFADPIEVKGSGVLNETTRVDECAVATLKFPGNILATVATGVGVGMDNTARVFGTEGSIFLPSLWIPAREGGAVKIVVQRRGEPERKVVVDTPKHLYSFEADAVAANLAARQAPSPAMSWDDTLGNMRTLDLWRQSFNFSYDFEKPGAVATVNRAPLAANPKGPRNNMKYGKVPGVSLPVSRLLMGVDNVTFAPHCAAVWDDFFTRGGNAWDCAYVYGGGASERALGAWVKGRGVRKQVVILDKGAHTPYCTPFNLTQQHKESLARLQMDYVDIYMMHRDNPAVPVGEFVNVLNEHLKAGTMKAIGGSNWSPKRFDEFNAWAKKNGKAGFAAISNNFSLAAMMDPIWAGCVSASDAESRKWLTERQVVLMAWSSQARGFFVPGRAAPDKKDDPELVKTWYSEENFRRQARAFELAKKKNVLPINIALAYVLCQPFPTFPLIGPRAIHETRTSLPALDVQLTPDELKWLNLEM